MIEVPDAKIAEKAIPLNEVVISLYEAQDKIYPRSVSGFFTKWRWVMILRYTLVTMGSSPSAVV
jgi:hypothetical protein